MNENEKQLAGFKEAHSIVISCKDAAGNTYNSIGCLNQAAWIGEQSGWLIRRIEILEAALKAALSEDPAHWKELGHRALND